ncbi:MAG TPA: ATP-binding protein [Candidatus Saccharimonadales bacterium]|nr:ATP-binding protein [Candidatus Saccharimonadales bacterium]
MNRPKNQSKINFEELFHASPFAGLLIEADGKEFTVLAQNKAHANLTKTTPEDIVGQPLLKAFPGISGKRDEERVQSDPTMKAFRSVMDSGKLEVIDEIRYDIVDKDGHVFRRFWKFDISPIKGDDDKVSCIYLTVQDVTGSKIQSDNLRLLSQAGRQFSASLKYTDTLHNIASLVVPDVADWCTIDLLRDDGQIEQVVLIHKDPKKIAWAKELRAKQGAPDPNDPIGVPHVIRTGKPEHMPVITDDMLKEAAENDEQLKLTRSLNFSSVMILPLKIDGRTIGAMSLVSTEGRRHYDEDDLNVGQSLADRAALAVYNAKLYQSAREELTQRNQLQSRIESINESLEDMVKQRTLELEAVNRGLEKEIDKRELAEAELIRSNDELQNFAYVASHDLQEPLRKIQAFGNLLDSEYRAELGDGKDYLDRMQNAASRMSVLIDDLLSFSRVSTGTAQPARVDLNDVVGDVISDLESLISDTSGKVTVDKLPVVTADDTHMRQLFQNLISNAIKFRRDDVKPQVKIDCKSAGKFYEITVKDNGIGFDEKYLDRIFTVFQRLHGREAYSGTGIGLAVCQKIVQRYGGIITAKSRPQHGSTFIIRLPKQAKRSVNRDQSHARADHHSNGR